MRILLGTRNSKLKTFESSQIDYDGEDKDDLIFHLYVTYFHIWFIPFFPTGRYWQILDKRSGEEITETTPSIRHALTIQELKGRKPLWTYSGPLVIGLGIVSIIVLLVIDSLSFEYHLMKEDSAYMEKMNGLIDRPSSNDVYFFNMTKLNTKVDKWGTVTYIPGLGGDLEYMVIDSQEDSITLRLIHDDLYPGSEMRPLIKDIATVDKKVLLAAAELNLPSVFWKDLDQKVHSKIR